MNLSELRKHREELMTRAKEMASQELEGEDLEQFEALETEIRDVQDRVQRLERVEVAGSATHDSEQTQLRGTPVDRRPGVPSGHPSLLVSEENLRAHAEAIRNGASFGAVEEIEERANVTVATDYGSPGSWGSAQVSDPVTLRQFAGIPNEPLEGATAQMPSLTLPVGSAGVAEGIVSTEFDATDVVNLTTLAYGRWTQVTSFVQSFTDLTAINQAHAVGIARDLNLLDVTAIQTAAGSVTAFDATNLDRNVRQAILKVAAAAIIPPEQVVLFGTSAALGVVTGFAPASGADRGSVSTRVYGARVYVSEAAAAGNVYCFAPTGFQTFSTGLTSASVLAPDTRLYKFGSWVHSTAPGVFIVGSAAGVDVVTP